jgi:hypothetical protein
MQLIESQLLTLLMISWIVITVVLVGVVVYRGTLSSREDDEIIISEAEQHHFQEQQVILARMMRLTRPIIALGVISGVLLLTSAGLWMYQGYISF